MRVALVTNIQHSTATIANGASLSGVVDLGGEKTVLRVLVSASWTAANLTFQVSDDGANYGNLYDAYGVEYTVVAAAAVNILIPVGDLRAVRYLKVRSGTAGSPVNQGAERVLTITAA